MKAYWIKYKGKSGQDQGQKKKLIHLNPHQRSNQKKKKKLIHLNARDQYPHQRSNQKRRSKKKKRHLMLLESREANRNLLKRSQSKKKRKHPPADVRNRLKNKKRRHHTLHPPADVRNRRKNKKRRHLTLDPPADVRNRLKNKKRRHRILRAGDHRQLDQESQGPGLDVMSQLHRWLQLKCMMKSQEEGANQLLVRRKGSMKKHNAIKLNRDHPASLQLFYQFKGASCHRRRCHLKAVQGVVLFPSSRSLQPITRRVRGEKA